MPSVKTIGDHAFALEAQPTASPTIKTKFLFHEVTEIGVEAFKFKTTSTFVAPKLSTYQGNTFMYITMEGYVYIPEDIINLLSLPEDTVPLHQRLKRREYIIEYLTFATPQQLKEEYQSRGVCT